MLIPKEEIIRDKKHLKKVKQLLCVLCQQGPCDAHHLTRARKSGMGLKVGDNYTIPLCRSHHRQLHDHQDGEIEFFHDRGKKYGELIKLALLLYKRNISDKV